ncbi:hypothetical protein DCMF_19620 [Candidatus Formimonas warabiya]|uniref:Uncharacterized protein n=2 Tax=Formimonas warabiya TaxID=1761012 RepID=A0A3G1KWC4_FORW1|nr:hypothetical protein DCMF_19620 [Candidatus Formimonas warabiya]
MKQKGFPTLALTLAITLGLLSGCQNTSAPNLSAAPALTMDKASEVNTAAHLLENYKTITYAQLDYIGGNTMHMTYFKDENGNYCATEDDSGYTGYRTDCFTFSREKGESAYHLSATKDAKVSDYLFMVSDSAFISQVTDASGNLVCKTQADIDQDFADQLSETWPATTEDKMVTTTVFAADDFRVLSIDFSLRRPDGSESQIASGVMLYDREVQYTDAVQSYLDAEKYTVAVQMPDGSRRTARIPKGETFSWDCDEGFALYLDAAGKTPLSEESVLTEQDMTLYVLEAQN